MMFAARWPLFMNWARYIDPFGIAPLGVALARSIPKKISEGQSTI
jgi:hypothetical protein